MTSMVQIGLMSSGIVRVRTKPIDLEVNEFSLNVINALIGIASNSTVAHVTYDSEVDVKLSEAVVLIACSAWILLISAVCMILSDLKQSDTKRLHDETMKRVITLGEKIGFEDEILTEMRALHPLLKMDSRNYESNSIRSDVNNHRVTIELDDRSSP
jgi:hypothetical protein